MATARELGPAGWQSYLIGKTQAPGIGTAEAEAEATERLRERVRQAAEQLKALGARRVVLFGSLAHGSWWAPGSDVDLAVTGLPPERFWDGWRVAEDTIGDRRVDLVAWEQAGGVLRAEIERDGVEL